MKTNILVLSGAFLALASCGSASQYASSQQYQDGFYSRPAKTETKADVLASRNKVNELVKETENSTLFLKAGETDTLFIPENTSATLKFNKQDNSTVVTVTNTPAYSLYPDGFAAGYAAGWASSYWPGTYWGSWYYRPYWSSWYWGANPWYYSSSIWWDDWYWGDPWYNPWYWGRPVYYGWGYSWYHDPWYYHHHHYYHDHWCGPWYDHGFGHGRDSYYYGNRGLTERALHLPQSEEMPARHHQSGEPPAPRRHRQEAMTCQ